jgi:hypothetical protein
MGEINKIHTKIKKSNIMKNTIRLAAVIIALTITFTSSPAKTSNMTKTNYDLMVNKIDNNIIGTWEKNPGMQKMATTFYCQFNANGTFISFERTQNKYTVTGRGKWMIHNGTIYIIHGAEKSVPVVYEAQENRLVFSSTIFYTKPSATYASK